MMFRKKRGECFAPHLPFHFRKGSATSETGAVRDEYDGETEKGEEVMLGIDLKIQIQRVWLEIAIKTA